MTTLQYSRATDTFKVSNEGRIAYVPSAQLYERVIDQDLMDAAQQAGQNPGDVVIVSSSSNARGLRPRAAQRLGVIQ